MKFRKLNATLLLVLMVWIAIQPAFAGGFLVNGSAKLGAEGKPILWDLSSGPIQYRLDGGPLSINPSGTVVIDQATGAARVQSLFQTWQNVPTTAISFQNAGAILPVPPDFTDGDVSTLKEYNAVSGSCGKAVQSPVMFDADGSIFAALGADPSVIGFAGPCAIGANGHILSAQA